VVPLCRFLEDRLHSAGQLYLLDFTIDPSQMLTVQIVENAAQDYAGHRSLASNIFEVLNCECLVLTVTVGKLRGRKCIVQELPPHKELLH
jgi:hypothetical protein